MDHYEKASQEARPEIYRHGAGIRDREVLSGELISTLCGQRLKRAPAGKPEWLWPTCPACWTITAARVGLRA